MKDVDDGGVTLSSNRSNAKCQVNGSIYHYHDNKVDGYYFDFVCAIS